MSIDGVAVRFQHEGAIVEVRLPKPNRHHHCFKYADEVLKIPYGSHKGAHNQGFYDSNGMYLDRKRAMLHVKFVGQQLLPMLDDGRINKSAILFSEDVWVD